MGKIKIHEISKKLGVSNKEVLEKAAKLGINATSHLNAIEEDEARKIEKEFGTSANNTKREVKEKNQSPVIIRREVIMKDNSFKQNEEKTKQNEHSRNVGFVEHERKKDYNIVYRNKPTKPMTVSELFGKKEEPKNQEKKNIQETAEQAPELNEKIEEKESLNKGAKTSNKPFNIDSREQNNNYKKPYNREPRSDGFNKPYRRDGERKEFNNNYQRPFNRESSKPGNNGMQRPFNRDSARNGNNNIQRPFNKDGGRPGYNKFQNGNGYRRPLDERGIEKNIKNIMSQDIVEKESTREYGNKQIDKQKNSRYEENKLNKKTNKSRKSEYEEINSHKLKSLRQEDSLSNMFNEGSMLDYYDLTTTRGKRNKKRLNNGEERNKQKIFELTDITIPDTISVKDLSTELKKTSSEIIKKLFSFGVMATINNEIDFDTAFLIAEEFGIKAHKKEIITDEEILFDDSDDKEEDLVPRPPVIVVMGHVDHGKTSLLDAVRSTNVIEGEAGGITQHIGAYKVKINDREITFLDTPGHEAFTAMRARGAKITDIAILVVAANDGVMPQTIEAINHAKAADIPIIVAVNKIDVEGANVEKVKQDLMEYGLLAEEWGGDTIFVPISAKKKINIDNLLEMVLLVADMKELKANPNKQAKVL